MVGLCYYNMQKVTPRQRQALRFVYESLRTEGFPPNFAELKEKLKISSNQSLLDLLKALEFKKYIKREEGARAIKILRKGFQELRVPPLVPFVGTSSAGYFLETPEMVGEWQPLSQDLARFGDEVFLVRVSGDSMVNAGIYDGDIIVVRKSQDIKPRDIVLAREGGETTIKRFVYKKAAPFLQPETSNPIYQSIPVSSEVEFLGKVIAVFNSLDQKPRFLEQDKEAVKVITQQKHRKPFFDRKDTTIYCDDFLTLESIPKSSVDLIVTSPPYNVDIHYNSHKDNLSYRDYLDFSRKWIQKCYDLARDDGRFCLNVPLDKNKGGQQSVGADLTRIVKEIGWKYHSTIIWNEGNISRRTAWGSFKSASAPYVIAPVEIILVLYKKEWKRTNGSRENDITKEEFMEWTNGVWTFNGQSKKGAGGHPAAFPVELPRRCIKLFTFVGDTVLDPFLGSGSSLIASYQHKRKGIGVDVDKQYCNIAVDRLQREAKIDQSNLL